MFSSTTDLVRVKTIARRTISPVRREVAWQLKRLRSIRDIARISDRRSRSLHDSDIEVVHTWRAGTGVEKIPNLQLACRMIETKIIPPGGYFSFWLTVGRPSPSRGFVRSRTIVGGQLVPQTGGGLCQISGMLLHLALLSGMKVCERHSHSIDIYQEEDRYAALGLDATVVFPRKDLIFRNDSSATIGFNFELSERKLETVLIGRVFSDRPILKRDIQLIRSELNDFRKVTTRVYCSGELESEFQSMYKKGLITP